MGDVVLDVSMSLEGFVTGPDVGIEHPLGEDRKADAVGNCSPWINVRAAAAAAY
jgi:hypothetical protein